MSEYLVKDTELIAVADAIRAKTGGEETLVFPNGFAGAIAEITTGIDAEVLENIPITLDFSGGNQTVNAGDGYVVKSAILLKPDTLTPENIAEGVEIAGITGSLSAESDSDGVSAEPFALITVTAKRSGVVLTGATVTATKGETVVTGTTDENGQCVLKVTETGTYTIKSEYDGFTSSSSSVTVSGFAYSASNSFFTATITVATETGATVTVTKGDRTYTATGVDMQAVITVYETGSYTVTSEYNGNSMTKPVDVTASTNYKLSMFSSHLVLEDTPWEAISQISAEGNPQNYFAIGDTKSVHINGQILTDTYDVTLYAYIIGFNHNESIEGKGIHFGTFKTADGKDVALCESIYGSKPATGAYGFSHGNAYNNGHYYLVTEMLGQTLSENGMNNSPGYYIADDTLVDTPKTNSFMAAIPEDLRKVLKKTRKYHNEFGSKTWYAELFINLLSSCEITGAFTAAEVDLSDYVQQYEYFAQGNPTVKYKHNATSTACVWYLRSSGKAYPYSNYGIVTDASGTVTTKSSPTLSYGFAPIFVV